MKSEEWGVKNEKVKKKNVRRDGLLPFFISHSSFLIPHSSIRDI